MKAAGGGKLKRVPESLGFKPSKMNQGELWATVGLGVMPKDVAADLTEGSEDAVASQDNRTYPLLKVKVADKKLGHKKRKTQAQAFFKESDRTPENRIEAGVQSSFKHEDFVLNIPSEYVAALCRSASKAMYDVAKGHFEWDGTQAQAYLADPSSAPFPADALPAVCDASAVRDASPGADALAYFAGLFTMDIPTARVATSRDALADQLLVLAFSAGFKVKGGKQKLLDRMLSDDTGPAAVSTASALIQSAEKTAAASAAAAKMHAAALGLSAEATAAAATTKADAMLRVAALSNDGRNAAAVYEKSGKRVLGQENFEVEVPPCLCADGDEAQIESPFGVDIFVSKGSLEAIQDYSADEPEPKKVPNTKPAAHAFLPFLRQYHGYEGNGDDISVSLDYDGKVAKVRSVMNVSVMIMVRMYEDAKAPPKFKLSLD